MNKCNRDGPSAVASTWKVKRMKAARLVVLGIALAAGGIAALLASGGEKKEVEPPKPVATLDTVDVLIAKGDIPMGTAVSPADLVWQMWPASASGSFIRKAEQQNNDAAKKDPSQRVQCSRRKAGEIAGSRQ